MFDDRVDAGRLLARELLTRYPELVDERPIVLAIPRGGVVVGREVANALGAPLDVCVARKLGAPDHEELGIGAIASDGTRVLDRELIDTLGVPDSYIEDITRRERAELERRVRRYRGDRPAPVLGGRAVIVVDDGLATGVTARAALIALRKSGPRILIFAAPVCSPQGAESLAADCDDVVCALCPESFGGVGEWYREFEQIEDGEVVELLG